MDPAQTAALAYWNDPEMNTPEWQDEGVDYMIRRSGEIMARIAAEHGVTCADITAWLVKNPQD